MTIQVTGVLRTPTGAPLPNIDIRIISVIGSLLVLEGAFVIHTTDDAGNYDFPLEDGQYLIDVQYDDEAIIAGSSIVNEGTPTPVNLSELFLYTTPLDPQQVIDLQDEFQLLIDNLESAFDTETQEIRDQLVDGDASTLQTAQTFTNDRLGAEMAVITAVVTAGDASVLSQSTAYTDTAGNLLANDITQVAADTASAQIQLSATIDSQGAENALIRTEIAAGVATAISSTQTYSDTNTGDLQVLLTNLINAGDATVLQTAGINAQSLNDATEAFLLDQIVVAGQGSVAGYEAYTIASLGYLDGETGLWVDGPLSSSFRAHTVSTSDGDYANIEEAMTTMAKPDGTLVSKGSLISDVNGRVAGYRQSNDGVSTTFEIIADDFALGHMDGNTFVPGLSFDTQTNLLVVKGDVIVDDTLHASKIIADSITAREIAADSITATEIQADSITGDKFFAESTLVVGTGTTGKTLLTVGNQFTEYYGWIDAGGQGGLAPMGSVNTVPTVRGVNITSIYSKGSPGNYETFLWVESLLNDSSDFVYNINGQDITFTNYVGQAYYALGSDILIGETGNDVFVWSHVGSGIPAVAGVNGLDDGTGEGTDEIRFWAGQTAANAHYAPMRVNARGDAWFDGDLNIGGSTIIGSSTDPDNYVEIHGTNVAGSSSPFLSIYDSNNLRARWDYDGHLRMFEPGGQVNFELDPKNGIFFFEGTVRAVGGVYGGTIIRASGTKNISDTEGSADSIGGYYSGARNFNDVPTWEPRLVYPAGDLGAGSTGLLIDTGYIATSFYSTTRQFVVTATRAGTWTFRTSKAAYAACGFATTPVPMQFVSGDTTYSDAKMFIELRVYSNYMSIIVGNSKISWKLSEVLLNE